MRKPHPKNADGRFFAGDDDALAEKSWSKKEIKKAGHELKAAANDVEMAMAWAGHKLEATTTAVLKDARAIAGKLSEETGWTTDEVGKGGCGRQGNRKTG